MEETKAIPVKGLVLRTVDGRTAPVFVCHVCGDPIREAPVALVVWDDQADEALTVHKVCAPTGSQMARFESSMELDTELAWLLWNSGVDDEILNRAREIARNFREL